MNDSLADTVARQEPRPPNQEPRSSDNQTYPRADAIDFNAVAWALLFSLFWGGLSSTIKLGLNYFPQIGMAGARFALGLLVTAGLSIPMRQSLRLTRAEWKQLAPLAFLFVVQIVTFNIGINKGSASHAVVLVNTHPLFVGLFAHWLIPNDRLDARKALGLIASFAGVVALFSEQLLEQQSKSLLGDALALMSGMLLGLILVRTKVLTQTIPPLRLLIGQYIIGVPAFFAISLLVEPVSAWHLTGAAFLLLLYQGVIVSGLCFVGMTLLLQRYPASKITLFWFTTPIFGAIISHRALGDPLTAGLGVGVVLVALGIYIANRAPDGQAGTVPVE